MLRIRSLGWGNPLVLLFVVAWALALGVLMDMVGFRIAGHTGLAAALEGVMIALGWGLIGLVVAAIIEPKSIGPFGSFNFGAATGLALMSVAMIGMMFE